MLISPSVNYFYYIPLEIYLLSMSCPSAYMQHVLIELLDSASEHAP